jgi:hypothetical protein
MSVLRKDVWEVSEHDFPAGSPIEAQLGFLLRYAILAPFDQDQPALGLLGSREPDPSHRRLQAGPVGRGSQPARAVHQLGLRAGEPAGGSRALRLPI